MACCGNASFDSSDRIGLAYQINRGAYLLGSLGATLDANLHPRIVEVATAARSLFLQSMKALSLFGLYDAMFKTKEVKKECCSEEKITIPVGLYPSIKEWIFREKKIPCRWIVTKSFVEFTKQLIFSTHLLSSLKVIKSINMHQLAFTKIQYTAMFVQFGMDSVEDITYIYKKWCIISGNELSSSIVHKRRAKMIHLIAMVAAMAICMTTIYNKSYMIPLSLLMKRRILMVDLFCSITMIANTIYCKKNHVVENLSDY